jgi:hypothetical protein
LVYNSPAFESADKLSRRVTGGSQKGGAIEYTMRLFAVKAGSPELLEDDAPQKSLFLKLYA